MVQVMPYSNAVNIPLSNVEANLNYKDATDPSVVVTFPVVSDPGTAVVVWEGVLAVPHCACGVCGVRCLNDVCVCAGCAAELSLVAWTTTPWTLPTN